MKTGADFSKKILVINMLSSFSATFLNTLIGFFLAPYLTKAVGGEAYGFVNLANQMVNYASIATVALNSVAGRFVTISMHRGEVEKANQYFTSVIGANAVLGIGAVTVFTPIVWNLEKLIEIPGNLVSDVKLLYFFVAANFVITIITSVLSVSTYITNRLYLTNLGNAAAAVIRVIVLTAAFGVFPTSIAYVGMSALASSLFLTAYNILLTKRLIPNLRFRKKDFQLSCIRELLSSGIWSSVTKLSQILSDGLDLLIANIGVSAAAMGQLSIAYTVPTMISSIFAVVTGVFTPKQTFFYAKEEKENLLRDLKFNMRVTGMFGSILFAGVLVYGREFFDLYVPSQNTDMIYRLSCLAIVSVLVSGTITPLHNVALLTDHLKMNSLVWLANSILVAFLTICLVLTTPLGVFAVAGVSRFCGLACSLLFTPIASASWLGVSKKSFYPTILRYMLCVCLLCAEFGLLKTALPDADGILTFVMDIGILGIMGMITNYLTLFDRDERKDVLVIAAGRFKRKKKDREEGK